MLFLRTGDLRLCLPAHILNNTLAVLLLCFPSLGEATESFPLWANLALGVVFTAFSCAILLPIVRPVWREKIVSSKN